MPRGVIGSTKIFWFGFDPQRGIHIQTLMIKTDTIESRVASAILERPSGEIIIDGKAYAIAPPSLATLILVSETIATLPIVEKTDDNEKKTLSVLRFARDYKALADIAAILILGAKNLTEKMEKTIMKRYLFGLIKRKRKVVETIDRKAELANDILLNVRPSDLFNTIMKKLRDNEVGIFFLITTSLSEANLLAPTRGVEKP